MQPIVSHTHFSLSLFFSLSVSFSLELAPRKSTCIHGNNGLSQFSLSLSLSLSPSLPLSLSLSLISPSKIDLQKKQRLSLTILSLPLFCFLSLSPSLSSQPLRNRPAYKITTVSKIIYLSLCRIFFLSLSYFHSLSPFFSL